MRRRGVAEAVDTLCRAFPEDWEAAPGARRESLAMLREAAQALVEAAHTLVGGSVREAERAAQIARRAHEAATGHGDDLRTRMLAIEAVNLAAQDRNRADTWRAGFASAVPRDAFAAAVAAWRGEAPSVRKWDGIATMLRKAGFGRYTGETLHRQWKTWCARQRGDR